MTYYIIAYLVIGFAVGLYMASLGPSLNGSEDAAVKVGFVALFAWPIAIIAGCFLLAYERASKKAE